MMFFLFDFFIVHFVFVPLLFCFVLKQQANVTNQTENQFNLDDVGLRFGCFLLFLFFDLIE